MPNNFRNALSRIPIIGRFLKRLGSSIEERVQQGIIKYKRFSVSRFIYRFTLVFLVSIHAIVAIAYVALTPKLVEKLIIANFNEMTYGSIELKVHRINPLTGFEISDLIIKNGPEFDYSTFFKLERINVSYSLPAFLWLNFNIPEISITKPHIWLAQKKGHWNFAKLMKSSDKPEDKAEDEDIEVSEPMQDIKLPIALRLFFRFVLEDFRAYVNVEQHAEDNIDSFRAGVEGFTLSSLIEIRPTKVIPLNPIVNIVKIFKTIDIVVNSEESLNVWYTAKNFQTKPKFYSYLKVHLDSKDYSFQSKMKLGIDEALFRVGGRRIEKVSFKIEHDLLYNPEQDKLSLDFFRIVFGEDIWLLLKGSLSNLRTQMPRFDLAITQSDVDLGNIYPLYPVFTGDQSLFFAGKVHLTPLTIQGPMDQIKIDGNIALKKIQARMVGIRPISINSFVLDYHSLINANSGEAFFLRIDDIAGDLNGGRIVGKVDIPLKNNMPFGPLSLRLSIYHLYLQRLLYDGLSGPLDFSLAVDSTNGLSDISTNATISLKNFMYNISGSSSRAMYNTIRLRNFTSISDDLTKIENRLQSLAISVQNRRERDAFKAIVSGYTSIRQDEGNQIINGRIDIGELFFHQQNLYDTMPDILRGGATRDQQLLKQPVNMTGRIAYTLAGAYIGSEGTVKLKIPQFDMEDLGIDYKMRLDQFRNRTLIDRAIITSPSKFLTINAKGALEPQRVYSNKYRNYIYKILPDLKTDVHIVTPSDGSGGYRIVTVHELADNMKINVGGNIHIASHILKEDISGEVNIKQFNFNDGGFTIVKNMNMSFPFQFKQNFYKTLSRLQLSQQDVIEDFHFSQKPNFTIESLQAKHPAREKTYEYLKDFQAVMFFSDNTFELKELKADLLDGKLIGKDILFYVGNLKLEQMQYQIKLNMVNMDTTALDQTIVIEQEESGLLTAYVNLSGENLRVINPRGYVIVPKIGKKSASELLKALNEKEGESKLGIAQPIVENITFPKSFEFRLGDGNVYPTVYFNRGALSFFADLHPEVLRYKRIPIQEFVEGLGQTN